MANIFLRSPFYFYQNTNPVGALSIKLEIEIDTVLRYTLIKNTSADALFEVSELIRDYLDIYYNDEKSQNVNVRLIWNWYDGLNGTGTSLSSGTVIHFGIDAYGYFEDGSNPTTTRGYMQSNDVIYRLADSDIRIQVDRNNTTSVTYLYKGQITKSFIVSPSATRVFTVISDSGEPYDSFKDRVITAGGSYEDNVCISEFLDENETFPVDEIHIATTDGLRIVKVITIDECKFTPVKLSFINRWGALQDLWFFKKSIETLNASREQYKRAVIDGKGEYNTLVHPKKTYNVKSSKKITINTGYVSDQYNEPMQELIQSEQVWMEIDSVVTPMTVDANSFTFKTSVNDKLVDYTIDLSYAYNAINDIR
jgi:hypothetical protein